MDHKYVLVIYLNFGLNNSFKYMCDYVKFQFCKCNGKHLFALCMNSLFLLKSKCIIFLSTQSLLPIRKFVLEPGTLLKITQTVCIRR